MNISSPNCRRTLGPIAWIVGLFVFAGPYLCFGEEPKVISTDTLQHKVLCGYQGWFRCPGDGTNDGWLHWSRNHNRITPDSLTVEMWPDMTEYSEPEKYAVPGFSTPDDQPAHLFSSANRNTVERHFQWMQEYGIDGVFVQRFLVNAGRPSFDKVLENVRKSATKSGRVYAIGYDLSGTPKNRSYDSLVGDWKQLVDQGKVTQDDRYLHHNEKPVVFVWGFFDDRFDAVLAHRIIDFFKSDDRYAATLIGGCQWQWRKEVDKEWARAFRRFDVISPWNVGNYSMVNGKKVAATDSWRGDLFEARKAGVGFMPVIYPGFGWANLKGKDADRATIPRRGGEFYWEQFVRASELEIDMAYVAMFDEVDEATAIFKVTNAPPTQVHVQTYEGLPPDWYLQLTGEGTMVIRGDRKAEAALPIPKMVEGLK